MVDDYSSESSLNFFNQINSEYDELSHSLQNNSISISNAQENILPPEYLFQIIGVPEGNNDSTRNSTRNSTTINFNVIHQNEIEKKPRGRKTPPGRNGANRKRHGCSDEDNILTKIQVHFLNFVISFLNDIIFDYFKNKNIQLAKFAHKIKSKVSSVHFTKMKNSTIYNMLEEFEISPKYKTDKNINKKIVKYLEQIPLFNKLFWMKFLDLFHRYYLNETKELKKVFVFDREITLLNGTESYYFLLKKNKSIKNEIIEITQKNYCFNNLDMIELDEKDEAYIF